MKTFIKFISAIFATLFLAACSEKEESASNDEQPKFNPPPKVSPMGEVFQNKEGLWFVRVTTVEGSDPNKRVQRELSEFNTLKKQIENGNRAVQAEADPIKKQDMEAKLKQMIGQFNNLKTRILKTYGVSVDRPYLIIIEESDLYLNRADTQEKTMDLSGAKK